jgi:hypothetical protein
MNVKRNLLYMIQKLQGVSQKHARLVRRHLFGAPAAAAAASSSSAHFFTIRINDGGGRFESVEPTDGAEQYTMEGAGPARSSGIVPPTVPVPPPVVFLNVRREVNAFYFILMQKRR